MIRARGTAIAAALALCAVSTRAFAHPIHTTMTAVTTDARGTIFTIRSFADDFSASVALFAGKQPPKDSSVSAADVARYLNEKVHILDARGERVALTSCGVNRARELYWLCVRIDGVTNPALLSVENTLLIERHDDQVNIVQVTNGSARKTLLFTKRSRAQSLGS